ncbi:MAG: hypothetical protein NC122_09490 [Faecalibacterium sp.]|nr:hypothetical protein [Ruminococcus sp.]MCM1392538.1 hypothetical protein [Ruminococcus sp.]MCM1486424.1 hypothetical protein [Faecalibacterium sp.]
MNKKRVNSYLKYAILMMEKCKIANDEREVNSTYRANISGFGAAVLMGSFKAAVAFYAEDAENKGDDNKNDDNKVSRSKLIQAMYYIVNYQSEEAKIKEDSFDPTSAKEICGKIINIDDKVINCVCDQYIDASIALKLAMSAFDLQKPKTGA